MTTYRCRYCEYELEAVTLDTEWNRTCYESGNYADTIELKELFRRNEDGELEPAFEYPSEAAEEYEFYYEVDFECYENDGPSCESALYQCPYCHRRSDELEELVEITADEEAKPDPPEAPGERLELLKLQMRQKGVNI